MNNLLKNNKIYCVADIHGCLDKLDSLLLKLDITPETTFVFTGDYVDRGPDSYGIIERLLQLKEQCNCVFLAGNHDVAWFDDTKFRSDLPLVSNKMSGGSRYSMWNQGARETYMSYEKAGKEPSVHYNFYKILEPYYVLEINNEKHLFVHGGYNRHLLIEDQKNSSAFWWDRDLLRSAIAHSKCISKEKYSFKNKDEFKYIYVGHTPIIHWGYNKPTLFENVWALDTGVGKYTDATLYALEIITQTLIS